MSSNRLIYDSCAYNKKMQESTSPLNYNLYPGKFENSSKCRIELGSVGGNNVSLFSGNLVDLESELRNQTRPASLCPKNHYQPQCSNYDAMSGLPCGDFNKNNLVHQPSCQMVSYPSLPLPMDKTLNRCAFK
jgi:hypothetical protein